MMGNLLRDRLLMQLCDNMSLSLPDTAPANMSSLAYFLNSSGEVGMFELLDPCNGGVW